MNILEEYAIIEQEDTSNGKAEKGSSINEQYIGELQDGTRNNNGSKKLKELTPRHLEMVAMHLDGARNRDIAQSYNVTDSNVSIILSDPLAVAIIQSARKENEARFASLYGKVVDVIEDSVSTGESIDVRLKGASLYLKEAGNQGGEERQTAEDVVQQIINMQVNGNIIVQNG